MIHYRISTTIDDEVSPPEDVAVESLDAARDMAAKIAGDLIRDPETAFWTHGDLTVDVSNGAGLLLFSLRVVAVNAPAMVTGRRR